MNGDTERIEKLLRNAPRPAVPSSLREKLKSEVHLSQQPSTQWKKSRSADIKVDHSPLLSTLLEFLKSHRLNLGGLGLAWTVILLCRVSLPGTHEAGKMAELNRPSPEMLMALTEENQRLLLTTIRTIKPDLDAAKVNMPSSKREVQKKTEAG